MDDIQAPVCLRNRRVTRHTRRAGECTPKYQAAAKDRGLLTKTAAAPRVIFGYPRRPERSSLSQLLAFVLLIGPLIFIHELGHLLAAKLIGVKVVRFSIGFGPAIAKMRIGETEYRLAPIPLGGYVTLLGQSPTEVLDPQDADRALRNKPLWGRYLVLGAGPAANLILPFFLYFAFFLGHTEVAPPVVGTMIDGSAAASADLQTGDRVVSVEGVEVQSWRDLQAQIRPAPDRELLMVVDRDGERFERYVTPRRSYYKTVVGEIVPRGLLGVFPWVYAPQIGIADPNSPAAEEGLQTGDIITSINGEPVTTVDQLELELSRHRDASLRLTYLRAKSTPGPLANYLWFESRHARLLPRKETGFRTGIAPANTFIRKVDPESPAARAGIVAGDRVLAFGDKPVTRWETLSTLLDRKGEEPVELTVQTPGQLPRMVEVAQQKRSFRDIYQQTRPYLWFGAHPYQTRVSPKPEPIRGRFTYAVRAAVDETVSMLDMMWTSLRQMLTLERGVDELSSVVGIFNVAGTAAEQGPGQFLLLMALISMNLGFVNLLPIPILDGGHLLFFTIEAIRRRPLSQRAREIASAVGLLVILILLLIALRNDIVRYWLE